MVAAGERQRRRGRRRRGRRSGPGAGTRRSGPGSRRGLRVAQPVEAEALHREAGQHAPHHDGPPHGRDVERAGAGQVAHEAAGEAVAGAGGVEELGQRVGRAGEDLVAGEEERAVLARASPPRRGGRRTRMARAALTMLCSPASWRASASLTKSRSTRRSVLEQALPLRGDPEVHGVGRPRSAARAPGRAPRSCSSGSMLPRKTWLGVAEGLRQLGAEVGEDVELGVEGVGLVQVELVAPRPAEGPARAAAPARPGRRRAPRRKSTWSCGEVLPDHRHHPDRGEEARRRWRSRSPSRPARPRGRRRASGASRARPSPPRAVTWTAVLYPAEPRPVNGGVSLRRPRRRGSPGPALGRQLAAGGGDVAPAVPAHHRGHVGGRRAGPGRPRPAPAPGARKPSPGFSL